eukprot:6212004-Pleurochrysis_carterae.AAC.3
MASCTPEACSRRTQVHDALRVGWANAAARLRVRRTTLVSLARRFLQISTAFVWPQSNTQARVGAKDVRLWERVGHPVPVVDRPELLQHQHALGAQHAGGGAGRGVGSPRSTERSTVSISTDICCTSTCTRISCAITTIITAVRSINAIITTATSRATIVCSPGRLTWLRLFACAVAVGGTRGRVERVVRPARGVSKRLGVREGVHVLDACTHSREGRGWGCADICDGLKARRQREKGEGQMPLNTVHGFRLHEAWSNALSKAAPSGANAARTRSPRRRTSLLWQSAAARRMRRRVIAQRERCWAKPHVRAARSDRCRRLAAAHVREPELRRDMAHG